MIFISKRIQLDPTIVRGMEKIIRGGALTELNMGTRVKNISNTPMPTALTILDAEFLN